MISVRGDMQFLITLRASHNTPGAQRNVHARHRLIVSLQLILELPSVPGPSIELNASVPCDSQGIFVGREGMVGDGIVEEMVNFGSGHV